MTGGIDIGLVNNMPDSALKGTERQFARLLAEAAPELAVRLHLFTLPEIARSDRARAHCDERYGSLGDLLSSRLDALIVTGAEPRAASLRDEPSWRSLTAVFDWAATNTVSTLLSCLAAHAAVLHFDGIERRRLADKRLGVFDHLATGPHALTEGAPGRPGAPPWRVAHSRWNELPEAALAAHGYQVLTRSAGAGADLFVKPRGSLFVHVQGHPEYDPDTLLKEYQRDIRRYLAGEQDRYPVMPSGYFAPLAASEAAEFEAFATSWRRARLSADIMALVPPALLETPKPADWSAPGRCLYRNWLRLIASEARQEARSTQTAREPALLV